MTEFDPAMLSTMAPKDLAKIMKSAPEDKIAEVMQSDLRVKILDEIFNRMPGLFLPEKAGSVSTVIHWHLTGGADGAVDTYEEIIENGTCVISKDLQREPKLSLTLNAVDFLKIITGSGNAVMMFMTGKVKAKGDLGMAANISNYFDLPKA